MVSVYFLLGMTCVCVLVEGDQAYNYRNNGTYTHISTHSYNQSILKKKVWETELVNKGNQN